MSNNGDQITVNAVDLDDATQLASVVMLVDHYAREPHVAGQPLPDEVRTQLGESLRSHPTTHVWLAYDSARNAVGVAVCFLGFSTFKAKPLLNIHDLAVHTDARGKGVGTALMQAVEDAARELGCAFVTLEVDDGNPRARALYQRYGFQLGEEGVSAQRFMKKPL